jgi:hypothetical protein
VKHEHQTARKLLCGSARDTPGILLPVSETTFMALSAKDPKSNVSG